MAGCAFLRFLVALPSADVVHVHFSSDSSFVRKSYFIKAAHKFGKKIVLHQHGGHGATALVEVRLDELPWRDVLESCMGCEDLLRHGHSHSALLTIGGSLAR